MEKFLWGAATAAYQVEGAANSYGRTPSIWDTFSHTKGKISNGDTGDVACDHYHKVEEDLNLMQWLGINSYRFSISWSRILPEGIGKFNQAGIDFYNQLIDGLLARNIRPLITIYHWDIPEILHNKGGWINRESVDWFSYFTSVVVEAFGDRVKDWVTINEPHCIAWFGYFRGWFPPGVKDLQSSINVAHHLLLAHGAAVKIIHEKISGAKVGISLGLTPVYPESKLPEDEAAAEFMDGYDIRWFLDPIYGRGYPQVVIDRFKLVPPIQDGDLDTIATKTDFLGVNYYLRQVVKCDEGSPFFGVSGVDTPGAETTDMGWEINPEALTELLLRITGDYKPNEIYITENGSAWDDQIIDGKIEDSNRIAYLNSHINAVLESKKFGAPISGYFAWSLLDNFEWTHGFSKRFGLIHVDFKTLKRTPKASAHWYKSLISNRK